MEDFANIKMAAERWLLENNSKFQIIFDDQKENRLIFGNPDARNSFIVICPSQSDGESWSVCSDQENMLTHLQDVMEFVDSQQQLTIDRILDRVTRCLAKSTSCASSSSPADKEERDEEDNCEDATDGDNNDNDEEDDDDGGCGYYEEEDVDVYVDREAEDQKEKEEDNRLTEAYFQASGGKANPSTIKRLCSDMKALAKAGGLYGFTAGPEGNNLFKWKVQLFDIPTNSRLGKDLQSYAKACQREPAIVMEMLFPSEYPYSPPFLRVVRPRFKFLTGHVTIGGSICMEMLTRSGWLPTNDIEGVLVQVRSEILSDTNASLDHTCWDTPYTKTEAMEAFNRMVARYGWDK